MKMRKGIIAALLFATTFGSCNKDEIVEEPPTVLGEWNYYKLDYIDRGVERQADKDERYIFLENDTVKIGWGGTKMSYKHRGDSLFIGTRGYHILTLTHGQMKIRRVEGNNFQFVQHFKR